MRVESVVRNESGYSMIEVLATCLSLIVILGATLSLVDASAKGAPRDQERVHAIRDAQTGLHRMVRELRQAYNVMSTSPTSMEVLVTVRGQTRHVQYRCDVTDPADSNRRRCVRLEAAAGTGLPPVSSGEVVVDRVLNGTTVAPVFTFAPDGLNPRTVDVEIRTPAKGERAEGFAHAVTLQDGFFIRNSAQL